VSLLQATFLRGASALSNRKAENPVLAGELEQLQDDQLDTRCRRNGLSKKGGRDMQVCPPPPCIRTGKDKRKEKRKEKTRLDYTFRRQLNETPSMYFGLPRYSASSQAAPALILKHVMCYLVLTSHYIPVV